MRLRFGICSLCIEIDTLAIRPVAKSVLHIRFRQFKVIGQLPKLGAALGKCIAKGCFGQKMLCIPAVGSILAAFHQLMGAVNLMQRAGGQMAQFMIAHTPQKPGGADLGEIQKYRIAISVPDSGPRLGAAVKGDHRHIVLGTVIKKIRNLKHFGSLSYVLVAAASAAPCRGQPPFPGRSVP